MKFSNNYTLIVSLVLLAFAQVTLADIKDDGIVETLAKQGLRRSNDNHRKLKSKKMKMSRGSLPSTPPPPPPAPAPSIYRGVCGEYCSNNADCNAHKQSCRDLGCDDFC